MNSADYTKAYMALPDFARLPVLESQVPGLFYKLHPGKQTRADLVTYQHWSDAAFHVSVNVTVPARAGTVVAACPEEKWTSGPNAQRLHHIRVSNREPLARFGWYLRHLDYEGKYLKFPGEIKTGQKGSETFYAKQPPSLQTSEYDVLYSSVRAPQQHTIKLRLSEALPVGFAEVERWELRAQGSFHLGELQSETLFGWETADASTDETPSYEEPVTKRENSPAVIIPAATVLSWYPPKPKGLGIEAIFNDFKVRFNAQISQYESVIKESHGPSKSVAISIDTSSENEETITALRSRLRKELNEAGYYGVGIQGAQFGCKKLDVSVSVPEPKESCDP